MIEKNFNPVLALRDIRIWLLEFWDLIARKVLPHPIAPPDAVNLSSEDLAGIKIKRNFNRLARLHVFQVLLKVGREHIAVGVDDSDVRNGSRIGYWPKGQLDV